MFDGGLVLKAARAKKAALSKIGSNLKAPRDLIAESLEPLRRAVTKWLRLHKTQRGRKPISYEFLSAIAGTANIGAMEIAAISLQALLNCLMYRRAKDEDDDDDEDSSNASPTRQDVCQAIGEVLNAQYNLARLRDALLRLAKKGDKHAAEANIRSAKLSGGELLRQTAIDGKRTPGYKICEWDHKTIQQVGLSCLYLILDNTKLIVERPVSGEETYIDLSPATEKCLEDPGPPRPKYQPMIYRLDDWTNAKDGGYLNKILLRLRIVRYRHPDQIRDISSALCPDVFEAVNLIQGTPWRVNRRLLEVAEKTGPLEKEGPKLAGPEAKQKEQKKSKRKRQTYKRAWRHTISEARAFADEGRFWLPVNMDYRGRMDYVPPSLNPQTSKLARALLEFADAEPVGGNAERGFFLRYGARLYGGHERGVDQHFLEAWPDANKAKIRNAADDPINNRWWEGAKDPWLFLRWCMEYRDIQEDAANHKSHLPIYLDGTCNAMQHLAALLQDEKVARLVNLVPPWWRVMQVEKKDVMVTVKPLARRPDWSRFKSDDPAVVEAELARIQGLRVEDLHPSEWRAEDIYQFVADVVVVRLKETIASGGEDADCASAWLPIMENHAYARKIVKQPVMTLTYGATGYGRRGQIRKSLRAIGKAGYFGESSKRAVGLMEKIIEGVVKREAPKCFELMRAISGTAKALAKEGLHMEWVVPTRFVVRQREFKLHDVRVRIPARAGTVQIKEPTRIIDGGGAARKAVANLVHSLDAAHLARTVHLFREATGAESFSAVHDSFATHCAFAPQLYKAITEAFIWLYDGRNLLDQLRRSWHEAIPRDDRPAFPQSGELPIRDIAACRNIFV